VVLLSADDRAPSRPQRILVAGTSGSGKSTFGRRLGAALDVPYTEIDALFHGPNWTRRESFEHEVDQFSATPRWVTEWQYASVRPILADRCDLMVWLDLPRRVVMRQVIRRTLRRRSSAETLWNGNLEPPLHTVLTDPDHIIRWAWGTLGQDAQRIAELQQVRPDLVVIRLRSHRQADRWLARLVKLQAVNSVEGQL
jgi:adenylate kinase family enzyme